MITNELVVRVRRLTADLVDPETLPTQIRDAPRSSSLSRLSGTEMKVVEFRFNVQLRSHLGDDDQLVAPAALAPRDQF